MDSGWILDEPMYAEFSKGLAYDVNIGHAHHLFLREKILVDSSSSDDLPDVAASMG